MTPREKKLALAVVAVLAIWAATQGLTKYRAALASNRAEQRTAEQELDDSKFAMARGELAHKKLRAWEAQSLPTNTDVAQSLYEDWLRQQMTQAGLSIKELGSKQSNLSRNQYYEQYTYTVEAEGKIASLTKFLYGFYQSGHLHRISKSTLTPQVDKEELTIYLTVDALGLPGCDRTDKLSDASSKSSLPERDELLEKIASRNLFAAYQPPHPKQPQQDKIASSAPDTEAAESRISSLTQGDEGWRMSVFNSKSGKVLFFREGDKISIGRFQGTITQLDARRVVIDTSDRRVQLLLGQTLDQAQPVREGA